MSRKSGKLSLNVCEEFRLDQTSLMMSESICLRKTSEGLGWSGLYAAMTDEQPHEALHPAVPAIWVATTFTGVTCARSVIGGNETQGHLPHKLLSITASGEAVHDEINNPLTAFHVYLSDDVLGEVVNELGMDRHSAAAIRSTFGADDPSLSLLVQAVFFALYESPQNHSLKIDYLSHALAVHLLQKHSTSRGNTISAVADTLSTNQLRLLLDYIDENLDHPLTIGELAHLVGVSKTGFIRKFSASTRFTPYQYVIGRRIRKAKALLARPNFNLSEIAFRCGFSDSAHFSSAFKRIAGLSPSEYRRSTSPLFVPIKFKGQDGADNHLKAAKLGTNVTFSHDTSDYWERRVDETLRLVEPSRFERGQEASLQGKPITSELQDANFVELVWRPEHDFGNRQIDTQHRALFNLANRLRKVILSGQSEKIAGCLGSLIRATKEHFRDEEAILLESGYPDIECHQDCHHYLLSRLDYLVERYENKALDVDEIVHYLMYEIVARHMLIEDKKFTQWVSDDRKHTPTSAVLATPPLRSRNQG